MAIKYLKQNTWYARTDTIDHNENDTGITIAMSSSSTGIIVMIHAMSIDMTETDTLV